MGERKFVVPVGSFLCGVRLCIALLPSSGTSRGHALGSIQYRKGRIYRLAATCIRGPAVSLVVVPHSKLVSQIRRLNERTAHAVLCVPEVGGYFSLFLLWDATQNRAATRQEIVLQKFLCKFSISHGALARLWS